MSKERLITLEEAESTWGNANFGDKALDKLAYIKQALDKIMRDSRNGWTMTQILMELKLITPKTRKLTKLGYYNLINL